MPDKIWFIERKEEDIKICYLYNQTDGLAIRCFDNLQMAVLFIKKSGNQALFEQLNQEISSDNPDQLIKLLPESEDIRNIFNDALQAQSARKAICAALKDLEEKEASARDKLQDIYEQIFYEFKKEAEEERYRQKHPEEGK